MFDSHMIIPREKVSVCMATYNGELYLNRQLDSILSQLLVGDELIVIDDCSIDSTVAILNSYADPRIKIFINSNNQGHVKTFERALSCVNNRFVLLADQDDIWIPGRVDFLLQELTETHSWLVTSTYHLIDYKGLDLEPPKRTLLSKSSSELIYNLLGILLGRRGYLGCVMALDANMLKIALPIPSFVEYHDVWFATMSNIARKNRHCERPSILRRIHTGNLTVKKRRSAYKIVRSRVIMLISFVVVVFRIFITNRLNSA
jgi:glycosyltransferase involved in cell wall biosynthesis